MNRQLVGRMNRRRAARQQGFSVVEALIAAALLLIIAIGVLPLFTRAIVSNVSGDDSTKVSHFSRSQTENLYTQPWNSSDLEITSGSIHALPPQYFRDPDPNSTGDEVWTPTLPTAPSERRWQRDADIRQFSIRSIDDGTLSMSEALPATSLPGDIHFKVIEVRVQGLRQAGPLESPKQIAVRMIKAK